MRRPKSAVHLVHTALFAAMVRAARGMGHRENDAGVLDEPAEDRSGHLIQGRIQCHVTSAHRPVHAGCGIDPVGLHLYLRRGVAGRGQRRAGRAVGRVHRLPSRCQARDGNQLPDPACTPGATNPAVTQATISATICTSGWTATIRPSTSITNKIKKEAIAAYGDYAGATPGNYELDHLISLELGGAPDAIANLWPEKGLHNAKDPVENAAKRAVCAHQITLTDAQHAIATNWITLGHRLGVSGIPTS